MPHDEEVLEFTPDEAQLFTHSKRPEWGAGLLTGEGRHRIILQFEDGKVRKMKEGFYHLLDPLDEGPAAAATLAEELERKYQQALRDQRELDRRTGTPVMSFEDQLRVFRSLYPGGFEDPAYVDSVRVSDDGRRRKHHRDPAIEEARELLSEERLAELIDHQDWTGVHKSAVQVLRHTDLCSPSKVVRPLAAMEPEYRRRFAEALVSVLYGAGPLADRFREWILALDASGTVQVNWAMASVLPALVHPEQHLAVKWKTWRKQALTVRPSVFVRRLPTPGGYERVRDLALATQEKLEGLDMKPRDLLDVREFAWESLRPRGQKLLAELDG